MRYFAALANSKTIKAKTLTRYLTTYTLRLLLGLICLSGSLQVLAGREIISFQRLGTEHGLPQGTVNTIFQDREGFIWFGTYAGLSRYDGYEFVTYQHDPNNPQSLSNNIVVDILQARDGSLWVATAQNGINRFDPKSGRFTRYTSHSDDFSSLSSPQVNALHEDNQGNLWVATVHGLNLFVKEENKFVHFFNNPLDPQSLPVGAVVDIADDGNGHLWVATSEMLAHLNTETQTFTRFNRGDAPEQITSLYLDADNSLWIGTRADGLYHYRPDDNQFEHYVHDPKQPGSLSFNDVRAILRDSRGDLWVGTEEGGLNVRRKGDNKFMVFQRNSADPHSLSLNDIWSLLEDRSGLLWIGTAGSGLNKTNSFDNYFSRLTHSPHNEQSLAHEYVASMREDANGYLWFATLNGLDRFDPRNNSFLHFNRFVELRNRRIGTRLQALEIDNKNRLWIGNQRGQLFVMESPGEQVRLLSRADYSPGFVSNSRVRFIRQDRSGLIWVALDDGLLKIDPDSMQIVADYKFSEWGRLGDSPVRTILQDEQGIIWFGTWNNGLQRYDPEFDTLTSFRNRPGDTYSLSNNTVLSLYQDEDNNLWIGTFDGLNLLSAEHNRANQYRFRVFNHKDGLPNNTIHAIVGDQNGNLWLSTNQGIAELNPDTLQIRNFTIADGLTANEFNSGAALRSRQGDIYFAGVNGITIVTPGRSISTDFTPPIHINSLQVGTRTLSFPKFQDAGQKQFEAGSNDIRIRFAALDYRHPNRIKYQYRLPPFRRNWSEPSTNNEAIFTNLDPGRYRFELRATNSDGVWSNRIAQLEFEILPPVWQTWWAYLSYALALALAIYVYFKKHARTLEEQRAINEHLRKVDQLKDEFLANTSHELRTPLNGIIGIAESLKEGIAGPQSEQTLSHLQLIIDGGKRLSQLINDILDFKKLTHNNLLLQRKAVDINSVVNVVMNLLLPLAREKNIKLINSLPQNLPLLYADENRLQQILNNLIGNAIKYTEQGSVEVTARSIGQEVEICIADTGIGIDEDKLESIFLPFEQATIPRMMSQRGTGLGLSVTKQLVEQHGGRIWVDSKPGHGSRFFFVLPAFLEQQAAVEQVISDEDSPAPYVPSSKTVSKTLRADHKDKESEARILIADDDPVNLQVLADLLQMNGYDVEMAQDGEEALSLAQHNVYDLVILDIMMPGLSGYEVCQQLRQQFSSLQLPILLLSARHQAGDITAGFEAGANDYVTKPIERQVLLSRIKTQLMLGRLLEAKKQEEHAQTLQQAVERLGRYFPQQVARQILTSETDSQMVAQRKQITILFADLAGFTSISDRFEPEDITQILNSFLGRMGHLVEQHKGVLNEILGDGLVVLFGAVEPMDKITQAQQAVSLALAMQEAMQKLAEEWLEAGIDHNVKLRIGIHQDYATVGNFGSNDLVAFRAVGSGVNLAARLEAISNNGRITVSYPVYAACKDQFEFSDLKEYQFKGFSYAHRVCELIRRL